MNSYEFTLTLSLPNADADPEEHLDALFEAGCDDALVGVGVSGTLALEFNREAESAPAALQSAIDAVAEAIPAARLVEVQPDLVGVSDIAALAHCSRQNIRKYVVNRDGDFPRPTYSGTTPLWHLVDVIEWFTHQTKPSITFAGELFDIAVAALKTNLDLQQRRLEELMRRRGRIAAR